MNTIPTTVATTISPGRRRAMDGRVGEPVRLHSLRERVVGSALTPDDPGYAAAIAAWNLTTTHRPVVVVRAADVHDVVAAVQFASSNGLGLGVQATGHGGVLAVDGVLVVTTDLDEVRIDPVARTARIGAGATWGPILAAAAEHGLAPLLGTSPGVGAIGYTLGGGFGWLARAHGPACDRLIEAELVMADGRLVRCAPDERPELLRALRGGGGGAIGVVTSAVIELVEVDVVDGGNLLYPAAMASEVAAAWLPWAEDAPAALTSSLIHMNFPPIPEVPEPLRGGSFTIVRGCWSGDLDEGRQYVDRLRDALPPIADTWEPMRFAASPEISNDPVDPLPTVTTGGWLDRVGPAETAALAAATFPAGGPPPLLFSEIRHVGPWPARPSVGRSVMANRDGRFLYHAVGLAPTPGADAVVEDHLARLRAELTDVSNPAAFLNFLGGAERRCRSTDAIAPTERRDLAHVHRWYDPDGLLRYGVSAPD